MNQSVKKKKILFIISSLNGGGAERAIVEMLKRFDFTRFDVTLCVIFYEGVYFDQLPSEVKVVYVWPKVGEGGYWVNSLRRKAFRQYYRRGSSLFFRWTVYYRIRERNFDTIVSYLEGVPLLFHSFLYQRAKRNISWIHCDLAAYHWSEEVFPKKGSEEACYAKMDELVFVSNNILQSFIHLYPQLKMPMRCIYNVIDVERIRELSKQAVIPHQRFTIIAIGTLIPVKGFDRLLRVARLFKDYGYDLQFQILGRGEDEDSLKALSRSLDVDDSVQFLGFQPSPYPYLAAADILLSTSRSEALPFVICEALALGIPVVATRTAGSSELLNEGKYGILVEQDDKSVFEGIRLLVDNKEVRKQYQQKACERASIFRVNHTMEQIYNLLEGV